MWNPVTVWFLPVFTSPINPRHVLWMYIKGQVINAVVFGGVGALAWWLASNNILSESSATWVNEIVWGLFYLFFVFSTAALPFGWWWQWKARRNVRSLMKFMVFSYEELNPAVAVSAIRVRELVDKAADAGVVWPSPLFALLDDVIVRGGRI